MIDEFRAAFQELIDASVSTDPGRFPPAVHTVHQLASQVPPSERELALEALGPFLGGGHTAPGIAADLSLIAGALVEMGADPGPAGAEVVRLLRSIGQGAAVFLHAWEQTGGGPAPEPDEITAAAEERVAERLGESAATATVCWWTIRRYGLAARTMLTAPGVRSAVRADPELRAELVAISNQLSVVLPEFGEIRALLRMAEATSAVVLDRASGRAFRVLFDGIGDNFQLHTLLADALIGPEGRGLPGRRPDPRWTAAFRDGRPDARARVVEGWWNLVALDGTWVWNEGVPADIPSFDGEHVLVLEDQPYPRSWNAGRRHPVVNGWLEVEEEVSAEEAEEWWCRAAPAPASTRPHAEPDPEPELEPEALGSAAGGGAPAEAPAPARSQEPGVPHSGVGGGSAADPDPGTPPAPEGGGADAGTVGASSALATPAVGEEAPRPGADPGASGAPPSGESAEACRVSAVQAPSAPAPLAGGGARLGEGVADGLAAMRGGSANGSHPPAPDPVALPTPDGRSAATAVSAEPDEHAGRGLRESRPAEDAADTGDEDAAPAPGESARGRAPAPPAAGAEGNGTEQDGTEQAPAGAAVSGDHSDDSCGGEADDDAADPGGAPAVSAPGSRRAPSAPPLPPLPPGVSDSSGWGPRWL
ncbi:hypothetical protein [Streptomonospora wellingtoniae]|uniref:Uncharacterized protein n=1 Tax=Streptomonospora wellingtoniae TaxID=3075544 RepID=A0ABU2KWX7_9ACTN|nr:hypothetical protein [Streptomonospora sp. DSM 45055]MDT0303750.1 hypothetical protein [Streptomonospora sp. DSM 45055]